MYMCVVAGTILGIDSKYGKVREVEVSSRREAIDYLHNYVRVSCIIFSSGNRLQLVEMR